MNGEFVAAQRQDVLGGETESAQRVKQLLVFLPATARQNFSSVAEAMHFVQALQVGGYEP
jgi:hypothetical protein